MKKKLDIYKLETFNTGWEDCTQGDYQYGLYMDEQIEKSKHPRIINLKSK